MNIKQIVGLLVGVVCVVVGAYFVFSGYKSQDRTAEMIKHKVTGTYSKEVKRVTAGGIVLVVLGVGVLLYFRKKR